MNTKQKIENILSENEYISGATLANMLGISRNAVWKQVNKLIDEGYKIEAVPNKGYRLSVTNDALSVVYITKYLNDYGKRYSLEIYPEITSTNTVLKSRASELPTWQAIIAGSQTNGRGRLGRSFYSPSDTGVYISILLHPTISADKATRITTAAAVAACQAIEQCTDAKPYIKWVNDIFVNGKKVCGILTEGSLNLETKGFDWAVMGIGFNVYSPANGYPEEIQNIAGAITDKHQLNLRCKLTASFLNCFAQLYDQISEPEYYLEYKKRCFLIGETISVIKDTGNINATAIDINNDFGLIVQYGDGTIETLNSGEVSIKPYK